MGREARKKRKKKKEKKSHHPMSGLVTAFWQQRPSSPSLSTKNSQVLHSLGFLSGRHGQNCMAIITCIKIFTFLSIEKEKKRERERGKDIQRKKGKLHLQWDFVNSHLQTILRMFPIFLSLNYWITTLGNVLKRKKSLNYSL